MKDIYELYIDSLKGHKKTEMQNLDKWNGNERKNKSKR